MFPDQNEEEKATKRARGEFDLELPGLSDEARKAAWRKLLVIPGSGELAVGYDEFLERTGGIGDLFYRQLAWERRDAAFAKAKKSGAVKTSIRERTHTAS